MNHHNTLPLDRTMHTPLDTPSVTPSDTLFDTPFDTPFDTALRQHFKTDAEPDDAGFSERVMVALPARRSRRRMRYVEWIRYAQWAAMSLAAGGVVALMSASDGRAAVAQDVAAYALIGLLIFWSIPSRYSRS